MTKAYITVKRADEFANSKAQNIEGFIFTIKPIIEKNKEQVCKFKDQSKYIFPYKADEGTEIETFCKSLEIMARKIRKYYK